MGIKAAGNVAFRDRPRNESEVAKLLGEALRGFAGASKLEKEKLFRGVIGKVRAFADAGALDTMIAENESESGFNASLRVAAEKASRTPMETEEGTISNWAVGRVVVTLDSSGNVVGYDVTAGSEKNLHYAVAKAVCIMMLDSSDFRNREMLESESGTYLEGLGIRYGHGEDTPNSVYLGGIRPVEIEGSRYYLAGGSCFFNYDEPCVEKYIESVLQVAPKEGKFDKFTLAGVAETQIAEFTAEYLKNGQSEIKPLKKTGLLSALEVLH